MRHAEPPVSGDTGFHLESDYYNGGAIIMKRWICLLCVCFMCLSAGVMADPVIQAEDVYAGEYLAYAGSP
jgi:hypothetical protein